ncbi:MAG: transporter permease subunit [Frondihabitans sp.]|nr:transporter permease subunit [Frondihabitans sp.]
MTTLAASVALLVLWEVLADVWLSKLGVLASPSVIVRSLVHSPSLYASAVGTTGWVALRGWFFGDLAAVVVAILFVQVRAFEQLFLRLGLTLFCLPLVAVMPILQLTFDPDTAKVALSAMSVFFTTLVGTMLGLRSAETGPLTMIRAWGGGTGGALRFVRLPSGIPAIITGLQIGAPAAVLGAIFGEFIGSESGLGVLLINGLQMLDLGRVWSVALLATVMAAIPYALLGVVRRFVSPWSSTISTADPATESHSRPALARLLIGAAWLVGSVVVILLAWEGYLLAFHVSPFVGKDPLAVFQYLFVGDSAAANRKILKVGLDVTLVHAGVGYATGLIGGIVVAVLFALLPVLETVLTPLMVALRSVPVIVLTPVLILAFGRGLAGIIAITTIITFFPTLANVSAGLARVPQDALILMRSYRASTISTLWRVQLPYTLPAIFASARIAAPSAVLAATLTEWLATGDGLGNIIVVSRSYSNYTELWAAAAVLTAVSLLFYGLVSVVERRVLGRFAPSHLS